MTFRVDPNAIRGYTTQLADLETAAGKAKQYVTTYGDFDLHQTGLLGEAFRQHEGLFHAVQRMALHPAVRTNTGIQARQLHSLLTPTATALRRVTESCRAADLI